MQNCEVVFWEVSDLIGAVEKMFIFISGMQVHSFPPVIFTCKREGTQNWDGFQTFQNSASLLTTPPGEEV